MSKKYRTTHAITVHGRYIGYDEVVELSDDMADRYSDDLVEVSNSVNQDKSGEPEVNMDSLKRMDLKGLNLEQVKDLLEKVRVDYPEEKSENIDFLKEELYKKVHGEAPDWDEESEEGELSEEDKKNIPVRNRNVDTIKDQVNDGELEAKSVLEIEKKNQNRKTLVNFLEEKLEEESKEESEE
jgi:hypothetical protein